MTRSGATPPAGTTSAGPGAPRTPPESLPDATDATDASDPTDTTDARSADDTDAADDLEGLDEVPHAPHGHAAEMDEMLRRLARMDSSDPARIALRQHLVEAQLPLVHHLAQRFRGRGEPYDDLVQVGTIGLLNAVDRFDPERGSFTGFAVPTILGEIRRHFRDRGWALRVPRRLQEMGRQVSEAREVLTQQLGRSPTVQEIARHLDTDADLVLEALDTSSVYATVPLPSTPDEGEMAPLGFIDSGLELVEQRATLRPLLARLPARERTILALRFVRGMSQSQIAAEVGVSQMHVSRLITRSLAVLREGLNEEV